MSYNTVADLKAQYTKLNTGNTKYDDGYQASLDAAFGMVNNKIRGEKVVGSTGLSSSDDDYGIIKEAELMVALGLIAMKYPFDGISNEDAKIKIDKGLDMAKSITETPSTDSGRRSGSLDRPYGSWNETCNVE